MLTYCLKSKRNKKNIDAKMQKSKNGRLMLSSKCGVCGSKKSRFMKEQDLKGLLSNLGIKTPLNQMLLYYQIISTRMNWIKLVFNMI